MEHASEKFDPRAFEGSTTLQRDLVVRIAGMIHEDGLGVGDRLNESRLASRLKVSRTPLRAALIRLAELGFVTREPNRGVTLKAPLPSLPPVSSDAGGSDTLLVEIARDRGLGRLADQVSETELMRLYGRGRQTVQQTLQCLVDLGSIERRPGYGWSFISSFDGTERLESYRYRLIIEIAAVLEPGFALPFGWAEEMRVRHESKLMEPWGACSSVDFFEMNAAFHLGLATASGNRYIRSAVERQNQLRRLSNYHWKLGFERVEVSCREHLAILDSLDHGDVEVAAILLRRHLESAARLFSAKSE